MTISLSRNDLKTLVRELMQEVLWEMEQQMPDPDEGLELRAEIREYLQQPLEAKGPLKSLDEVMSER